MSCSYIDYFRMIIPSLSTRELSAGEYHDGELHCLHATSRTVLKTALLGEPWLNVSDDTRNHWLALMRSPSVRFVGTVISRPRQQVEVSVVFSQPHPVYGGVGSICVTLSHFSRFRDL